MGKDILRQVIRQTITEMFDLLDKGMLDSEQTSTNMPGTIEEQSASPDVKTENPKAAK
jgi:hypothetical protein